MGDEHLKRLTVVRQPQVVLVANSDDRMLEHTAHVIDRLGLVPLRAIDGAAALEFVSLCRALLVCAILDTQMLALDGAETAHAIQRVAPDLMIVLISGAMPVSLDDRLTHLRIFAVLHKPFPLSALSEVLVRAAGSRVATHLGLRAAAVNGKDEHYERL